MEPGAPARELFGAGQIAREVDRLAGEVASDHPEGVVLVGLLRGSVCLMADLVRRMRVPLELDFLAVSAYAEGTGRVRIVKDLVSDVSGRDVVLVEDVVDTGLTLTYLLAELRRRGPRSLSVCALVDKRARRLVPTPLRYVGFSVDDEYLLGYGLDFAQRYRNLRGIVAGDLATLSEDPDAYVTQLYRD
ncbi:MAG: hypoxanthine phosphoribosyltransferase [Acidimicrobiales bacterium]